MPVDFRRRLPLRTFHDPSIYRLNQTIDRLPIFDLEKESLVGFRHSPSDWAIEWISFSRGSAPKLGPKRVTTRLQDRHFLSIARATAAFDRANPPSLPQRNLLRGFRMQLLRVNPLPGPWASIRYRRRPPSWQSQRSRHETNPCFTSISPKFADNAPLWYYILAKRSSNYKTDDTPIASAQ